jgi:hypothetical protein
MNKQAKWYFAIAAITAGLAAIILPLLSNALLPAEAKGDTLHLSTIVHFNRYWPLAFLIISILGFTLCLIAKEEKPLMPYIAFGNIGLCYIFLLLTACWLVVLYLSN